MQKVGITSLCSLILISMVYTVATGDAPNVSGHLLLDGLNR